MTSTPATPAAPAVPPAPIAAPDPPLECDLVMKGGITSGVVYPLAVCELATVYRLRSVGGSSAGAIAAAAAACAELGRASGGFDRLAQLPDDLTATLDDDRSRLFTLFQPRAELSRLFRLATAGLGRTGRARTLAMGRAALGGWWLAALVGAALGILGIVVIAIGFAPTRPAEYVGLAFAVLVAVAGAVIGVSLALLHDVRRMPPAGYGLCSGNSGPDAADPALTPWLHQVFQSLAGRDPDAPPVTFRDLTAAGINLKLMTTNLSRRQPMSMPWGTGEYFFDPAVFRDLFPETVVQTMVSAVSSPPAPRTVAEWQTAVVRAQAAPLLPFPDAADLPVLVAVRMSLSFPGLIGAVPLHAVDYSLDASKESRQAVQHRHAEHPDETVAQLAAACPRPTYVVNWFSDGGICANLPLQFFDSVLPRRPTFAIDLAGFPADRHKSPAEEDNSYLPTSNNAGLLRRQRVLPTTGLGAMVGFFSAIVDTARTWVDEAQLGMPGYRDRIVTVYHDAQEGGMNLTMPPATVLALSQRGRGAANRLVDRFAGEQPGTVPAAGWDNHRWLRFRTAAAACSDTFAAFTVGYTTVPPGTTPYADWVGVDAQGVPASGELPSYPMTKARRQAANERTRQLLDVAADWARPPADAFTDDAPQPRPTLRLVPSDQVGSLPTG